MLKTAITKPPKHPYISVNPKIPKGSPIISGTRARVIDIAIEYGRCHNIKFYIKPWSDAGLAYLTN